MRCPARIEFTFTLTPVQAQDIFSALACFQEELRYDPAWKETGWGTKKARKTFRQAVRRFDRQLNSQYAKTGVEVCGDEMRITRQ